MSGYQGDFTTANTIYVFFNTFDSNDPSASVTLTGLATTDIEIYKDGSATTRASDSGYTLLDTDGIDFDGTTGVHGFSVALSDNGDAGFYAAGSEYVIVVGPVTVDAATVNFVAATFSIERAGGALALLKGTNSLANIEDKIDVGDICFCYATVYHGVAPVDTHKEPSWEKDDGRWFLSMYSNASDEVPDRHTASPVKLSIPEVMPD